MNIRPVSFGMAAIFTDKGVQQIIKTSSNVSKDRADNFVSSAEQFKRDLASTEHVDVIVDKTGVLFPRLKAKVVRKDTPKREVLSTFKQPRLNKTSTRFFDASTQSARNAEMVISSSDNFKVEA